MIHAPTTDMVRVMVMVTVKHTLSQTAATNQETDSDTA